MTILRFFQDGGRPPSWICYVCVRTTHEGYLVVFIAVQNLSYGDFLIFQDGGRRHLGFFKFQIFNSHRLKRVELRRCAKFGRNRSNRDRDMAIFRFLNMAAAAILDFCLNFKLLTVGKLWKVEVRRHAKFGQNLSKRGEDMAIFRFFKMAAAAILDFKISNF